MLFYSTLSSGSRMYSILKVLHAAEREKRMYSGSRVPYSEYSPEYSEYLHTCRVSVYYTSQGLKLSAITQPVPATMI